MANNLPKLPSLPKIKSVNPCDCGCGGTTGSRFVPGHDSKLAGLVKRVKLGLMTLDDVAAWAEQAMPGRGIAVAKATAKEMGAKWAPKAAESKAS